MSLSAIPLPESGGHPTLTSHRVRPRRNLTAAGALRLPNVAPVVDAKIATTREQLSGAFELVYQRYLAKGYIKPRQGKLLYHDVLGPPSSRTLIAVDRRERILGTLSIVGDNAGGLQAEATYPHEIESLRAGGRRPAEITCFAIREQDRPLASIVFFTLTKLMIHYAYWRGYSDLLMAIHPKHFRFYYRYFRTYPVGPYRPHALANGHPAVCHRIDIEHLRSNVTAELWQQYFSDSIPEAELQRPPIRPVDHEYFCRRSRLIPDSGSTGRSDSPKKAA